MRIFLFLLSAIFTTALVVALNTNLVMPAPLGKLLSPQHGLWQNSNPDTQKELSITSAKLTGKVDVYFDERLVPHVFADNETDAFFTQGYLHAKYRLWQMDFQTRAAAGRLSELVGDVALPRDREFRRLGMNYAAQKALEALQEDNIMKSMCDAYTAGVNDYIATLSATDFPVEYKLLGYAPEPWTNLKTMLFLKYMSYDLASAADDFEMTNAKSYLSEDAFKEMYPLIQDSLDPIIPGTEFAKPARIPIAPLTADSIYFANKDLAYNEQMQPDRENGSNNWAVSGKKTKSGYPILCNDPHLGLNLPSLWYEMQISTPSMNVYGATFPGSPCVIIGFNDSCAFGFTNGGRDVRDYYQIEFKDESRKEYLFNGTYHTTTWQVDTILVKGKPAFIDSVAFVQLGNDVCPVMYDKSFTGNRTNGKNNYAVRWTAHDKSNELRVFYGLDHAKNYADYTEAAQFLHTPGQNIVFATKSGDIALRTQGDWPAKWQGQGDFVMPGTDTSFLWQFMIPQNEVPFQYNPERGFVSSANQKPVAQNYPYYIGRVYPEYRGLTINKQLNSMDSITPQDMMKLQTSSYDGLAAMVMPKLLASLQVEKLAGKDLAWIDTLSQWNFEDNANLSAPTLFDLWWKNIRDTIYRDELRAAPAKVNLPMETTLAEAILRSDSSRFFDNIATQEIETLQQNITYAFKKMCDTAKKLQPDGSLAWYRFNDVGVRHLARLPAFSLMSLYTNGGRNAINANHQLHGPSWRMIVSLTPDTEAWGIYPGGQDGNPGSAHYDDFIKDWSNEQYYKLWMMKQSETKDKRVSLVMHFNSSK